MREIFGDNLTIFIVGAIVVCVIFVVGAVIAEIRGWE